MTTGLARTNSLYTIKDNVGRLSIDYIGSSYAVPRHYGIIIYMIVRSSSMSRLRRQMTGRFLEYQESDRRNQWQRPA
eukprot:scaffold166294_cov41-Prasinocladus_malaysianus.AAC.1